MILLAQVDQSYLGDGGGRGYLICLGLIALFVYALAIIGAIVSTKGDQKR